jgi:hypothetical protein
MEIKLVSLGNLKQISRIKSEPRVVSIQIRVSSKVEFKKPPCAVTTGKDNNPPPIDMAMINKILPNTREFIDPQLFEKKDHKQFSLRSQIINDTFERS